LLITSAPLASSTPLLDPTFLALRGLAERSHESIFFPLPSDVIVHGGVLDDGVHVIARPHSAEQLQANLDGLFTVPAGSKAAPIG
jgi:hypothetical protein